MGFLDERRRLKERRDARVHAKQEAERDKRREIEKRRPQEAHEEARLKEASKNHLTSSDFPALCEEWAKIEPLDYHYDDYSSFPHKKHPCSVAIRIHLRSTPKRYRKSIHNYVYEDKVIVVEALPSGEIYVHGGAFGSTRLSAEQWRGNRPVQERALEKAFKHPMTVHQIEERRPPDHGGP